MAMKGKNEMFVSDFLFHTEPPEAWGAGVTMD